MEVEQSPEPDTAMSLGEGPTELEARDMSNVDEGGGGPCVPPYRGQEENG